MSQTGLAYDSLQQKLLLTDDGFIETTNNQTFAEVGARLVAEINSYLFDQTFGCDLFSYINSRNNDISNNSIKLSVIDALTPMIEQGKISSDITVVSYIGSVNIELKIVVKDTSGKIIYNEFIVF